MLANAARPASILHDTGRYVPMRTAGRRRIRAGCRDSDTGEDGNLSRMVNPEFRVTLPPSRTTIL